MFLEINHGLDINNPNHIWLLHLLFLATINSALDFFTQSWNNHILEIRGQRNRSPIDMFTFDMLTNGVRGAGILEDTMSEEELEVYGVDWEGLQEDHLLASLDRGLSRDGETSSWVGQVGPPARLSEVWVESPDSPLNADQIQLLDQHIGHLVGRSTDAEIITTWEAALAVVRFMHGGF